MRSASKVNIPIHAEMHKAIFTPLAMKPTQNERFLFRMKKSSSQQRIPSLRNELSRAMFKKVPQDQKINSIIDKSHDHNCISLIKDPLWKSVCSEMIGTMGPASVQKIWNSKLGSYCSGDKSIGLCCPTDETAQFISQYSFLILGSLQRYFPAIKTLKTKVKHAN